MDFTNDLDKLLCVLKYVKTELRCIKQRNYFRRYYRKNRKRIREKARRKKFPPYMVKSNGVYKVDFE